MITADILKDLKSTDLHFISGANTAVASKVLPPESCDNQSLVFVGKPDQLAKALEAKAPIIVAHKALTLPTDSNSTFFQVGSIPLAMAAILPLFDGKLNRFNQETKIHPSAFIHPTAHVGKNVSVGPFAVIGEQATVGESATIGAHVVIESFAKVGDHTLLHPQVFIGAHCELGSYCEIHPQTVIGADGFSFAPNKEGHHQKLPQLGNVIIGNHVELGAHCAIDRGALTATKIGDGTKMDNFCHVAHNVEIGSHCVIAAGLKIAGSSKVGNHCMFGGDAVVTDHVTICDKVVIAGRSAVTNDITISGQYGGYPLEPLRDAMKTIANIGQLTRIRKELARVVKHLGLKDEGR